MTRSVHQSFSRLVQLHFKEEDSGSFDAAIIRPRGLYEELVSLSRSSKSTENQQIHYASIQVSRTILRPEHSSRTSVVVPITSRIASKDSMDDFDEHEDQEPSITIPSSMQILITAKALREGNLKVHVHPHSPVQLSQVFLAAMTLDAYEYAQKSQVDMEAMLDEKLIRQDDFVTLSGHKFRVVMTESVLQGIISSAETNILITLEPSISRSESLSQDADTAGDEEGISSDEEGYAIDERFLAKTVLDAFGSDEEESGQERIRGHEVSFQAIPVHDRDIFDEALSACKERLSLEQRNCDEESSILLDEAGLAALGVFDGDWVLASAKGTKERRIVQIFSASLPSTSRAGLKAHLSPLMLQNLLARMPHASVTGPIEITLQSLQQSYDANLPSDSTAGSDLRCPLPLPFADSMTISRVAGPLSTNRHYQTLFLTALRLHFEGRRRIVREGDVIAVGFDKGKVRWIKTEDEKDDEGEINHGEEAIDFNLPLTNDKVEVNTAIVYFCVTSVTPELSEPEGDEVKTEKGGPADDAELRELARIGKLGCVVDASLTKMVQTGITKMRVVDAIGWLRIEKETPNLPRDTVLTAKGSNFDELLELVNAILLPQAAEYGLHLTALLKGAKGSGKKTLVQWVAQSTGVHLVEFDCFDLLADTDARTEGVLRARFEQAAACGPAILLLRNIDALARKSQALETGQEPMMATILQDCIRNIRDSSLKSQPLMPICVFGTTSHADRCPMGILGCFKHEISIEAPNEMERLAILQLRLRDSNLSADVDLDNLATQTAALVATDLVNLVSRAQMASIERIAMLQDANDADIVAAGMTLTGKDFEMALGKARLNYSENIGAPKIPNVTWDDVGGLASVKDDILDTIQLPLEHPELFTDGLKKRSGILLYGPPGTGKTLLAKAVATSCSLNFFSVKGPELLNMYIGESEANVRRVFQRARDAKPCVIFFDELDSIAPKRGNQGDSGGVMDRIVSQLLAELDGMSSSDGGGGEVFVIGATNRPDLLDPALLRPGRFDRMLYLSVSETHADQLDILQALTRKFTLDDDVGDLGVIAEQCPFNLTGADFYALCSDAMLKSMTRKAASIDKKIEQLNERTAEERNGEKDPYPLTSQYYLNEMAQDDELEIRVNRQDFEGALHELVPSVSMQEMQHYRQVQAKFSAPKEETKDSLQDSLGHQSNGNISMGQLQEMYQKTMSIKNDGDTNGYSIHGNGGMQSNDGTDEKVEVPKKKLNGKGKGKGKARAD